MNQRDAIHYIATRQSFKASALSGKFYEYTPDTGRLDAEESATLREHAENEFKNKRTIGLGSIYVVHSYGTPVAWYSISSGWYIVAQKFSVTTSKHQNYVRRATSSDLVGAI